MHVHFILLMSTFQISQQIDVESNDNIPGCVANIIQTYFEPTQLSVIQEDGGNILAHIHELFIPVILITTPQRIPLSHRGYLLIVTSCEDFTSKLIDIRSGVSWKPDVKTLIVFKYIKDTHLPQIFNKLLAYHVINVVVLNGTVSAELYTYNPFENFGCGKRYDRIIKLGDCNSKADLFEEKLVTGLQNCTFRALSSNIPLYSIDPATDESEFKGMDQFVLQSLGEMEKFHVNFSFETNFDAFSIIHDNMSAVGPMREVQIGNVDIINGAMLLTYERAQAFSFLTGGETFTDYLHVYVAKSKPISNLKMTLSGFNLYTWFALFIVFVIYLLLMYIVMEKGTKQGIILKMIGLLFSQPSHVKGSRANRIFIFWVFFAYLISCYYQSTLVSLMMDPYRGYQISSWDDIVRYDLQPCVSGSMRAVTNGTVFAEYGQNKYRACEGRWESVKKVSDDDSIFTIYLRSLFKYNEYDYYDEFGSPKIHTVESPKAPVLYAIYMYKGFPLRHLLQRHCHRIEETGLLKQNFDRLQTDKKKKYQFAVKTIRMNVFIPWYVLVLGVTISTLTFCLEILYHRVKVRSAPKQYISEIRH
ncbi:unnamed protein product [Leptosia nina]|uniref:Putative ionotropic receptor ligand binding domain-containing protein n=1 Tax=Leptosia nina TaxID=320188 RepID=A0AAV1JI83_9NEOP